MRIKNKIKKRLAKINAFLESKKKPGLKSIHNLRLEVKHLEAFLDLMTIQGDFGARLKLPNRLQKLFHQAGELRKFELEMYAIYSVAKNKQLAKPTLFLQHIAFFKKKISKRLLRKRKTCPPFKTGDFAKHSGVKLTSKTWLRFWAVRASFILDLLKQDIITDIRSLHQLRKILKAVLYVLPLCRKGVKPVRVLLKANKKFIQSVEFKLGSIHDTDIFITFLENKHQIIDHREQAVLKRIYRAWQNNMMAMKKDLQPMLTDLRKFTLDLKNQSTDDLNTEDQLSDKPTDSG